MENTKIVETQSLTKRYGSGVLAVDSVGMSVRRGAVDGFLGPNGAGKTTTGFPVAPGRGHGRGQTTSDWLF